MHAMHINEIDLNLLRVFEAAQQVEIGRQADLANAKQMATLAEDFYVSLGMPKLPASFWTNTQFIQPRDREVVCHASAWDMNYQGDVRIKMCIAPTEDELTTIYHELGHVYYYLAYNDLPPLFQSGAHDGFHEAIGDTIVLSMTPKYLASVGLVGAQQQSVTPAHEEHREREPQVHRADVLVVGRVQPPPPAMGVVMCVIIVVIEYCTH